ncbi:enoyl-CoA hydratase/isomerase family protein [Flavobacteriaceae bacterium]|nr:enoyl-CoA hydratase/isomerase family protein [Flavobacteriaceae bacterium]
MSEVLYKFKNSIAIITLNRPEKYNAVNDSLTNGLNNYLTQANNDQKVRAIIITGSGRGFCSGADMTYLTQKNTAEQKKDYIIKTYQPLLNKFLTINKPIIGAINGSAAGVGASLALACDFRVMGNNSSIYFAFINIGLGPDGGGSWLLSRLVGYSKALEIAISGKKVMGSECYNLGLTNKLVEDDMVLEEAISWAKKLSKMPTLTIGITKEDMLFSEKNSLHDTISYEAEKQVIAFNSDDHKEGVTAFTEKRSPNFKGK